jgi:predicted Zn-dependent peptidase
MEDGLEIAGVPFGNGRKIIEAFKGYVQDAENVASGGKFTFSSLPSSATGQYDRLYNAYAGGDSKDPKAVAEAILDEAQRLAAEGVDGDYYKRIVNANFGAALKALNSFESIAVSMAEGRFQGYDPYRFPEIYDDITAEDVRAFLRENFTRAHMALSVIAPKEG